MEIYYINSTTAHIRAHRKNQTVSQCESRGSEMICDKMRLADKNKGSRNRQTIPHHKRQTKPSTGPRRRAEGLDPSGRLN